MYRGAAGGGGGRAGRRGGVVTRRVRLGLLGLGTVGGSVARLVDEAAQRWRDRYGVHVSWQRALVRDPAKPRPYPAPPGRLTTVPGDVVEAPDVDVVVEAMGGVEPAATYVLRAMAAGKHVVTANKALLAERWDELHDAAARHGVQLAYEAAVAAAVPCLSPFADLLAAARVVRIEAVLNGTCAFVLGAMERHGWDLAQAVAEAQTRGYAEPDPGDDVQGLDALRKARILCRLAFGRFPAPGDERVTGIAEVTPADVAAARRRGRRLRLVARIEEAAPGRPRLEVAPQELPEEHPLARLGGPENGLLIEAEPLGCLYLQGPGAGGPATASAILGDVLAVAAGRRGSLERRAVAAAPAAGD